MIDFLDRNFRSGFVETRGPAGDTFRAYTGSDSAARDREIGEYVARSLDVSPEQRIEAVQGQIAQTRGCMAQKRCKVTGPDRCFHYPILNILVQRRARPPECDGGSIPVGERRAELVQRGLLDLADAGRADRKSVV